MQSMTAAWVYSTIGGDGHQGVWVTGAKGCSQSARMGLAAAEQGTLAKP